MKPFLLLALASLLLLTAAASATVPPAPRSISAQVVTGTSVPGDVRLQWFLADSTSSPATTGTNLYIALDSGGSVAFSLGWTNAGNSVYQHTTLTLTAPGRYQFYATQYNADGEGRGSDTIALDFPAPPPPRKVFFRDALPIAPEIRDTLRHLSAYSRTIRAQAQGVGSDAVTYQVVSSSTPGADINAQTGEFQWRAPLLGIHVFRIRATSVADGSLYAEADFQLVVDTIDYTPFHIVVLNGNVGRINVEVGQPYRDSIVMVGSNGSPVWTRLTGSIPTGLQYDPTTGVLTWSPVYDAQMRGFTRVVMEVGVSGTTGVFTTFNLDFWVRDINDHLRIVGDIIDSTTGQPLAATVRLYGNVPRAGTTNFALVAEMSAPTGAYSFTDLNAGEYIVQAEATDGLHVVGYYKHWRSAARTWSDAAVFTMDPWSLPDTAIIPLPLINGTRGSNGVHGTISEGGGHIRKGSEGRLAGLEPLEGATVLAIDVHGRVSGYDRSDVTGSYTVGNLGAGTYLILADKPGYYALLDTVAFAADDSATLNLDARLQSTSSVSTEKPAGMIVRLHPNPARSAATIEFNGDGHVATVRLIDNVGREVLVRNVETDRRPTSITLPLEGIARGHYIVTLAGLNGVAAMHLVVLGR